MVKILKKCDKRNLRSVALPALGTGHGQDDGVKVIVEALRDLWGENEAGSLREVIFCDIREATVKQFVKTCDATFAGARPRREIPEHSDQDSGDDESDAGSSSSSDDASGKLWIVIVQRK